jgi:uncharacterized protein
VLVQIQNAGQRKPDLVGRPDANIHLFETEFGTHLLIVDGSRVYGLPDEIAKELRSAGAHSSEILARHGLSAAPYVDQEVLKDPPVRAISLAIAQVCNLGCVYCYAQQGSFGGEAKSMDRETAMSAVDWLLADACSGDRVQVTFLGGEPLTNRALLREATEYAASQACLKEVEIGFSITTNGTLVDQSDGEFFERHGFAVTISVDGVGKIHDQLRPFKNGTGSYDRMISRVKPLLERQHRMQVSARVTVTPQNLDLRDTLEALLELGFHSVGFSPILSSPDNAGEMSPAELEIMLGEMIACGRAFEEHIQAGRRYSFLNLSNALREIHKGTHRPYPCGAGAGYFGVSAGGGLYACHRFVDDAIGEMGSLAVGLDRAKRNVWLAERHVHLQEPCNGCWARYLCGGGCHHEVLHRGRPACDYIRGWLDYCLQAYVRLLERCPSIFAAGSEN